MSHSATFGELKISGYLRRYMKTLNDTITELCLLYSIDEFNIIVKGNEILTLKNEIIGQAFDVTLNNLNPPNYKVTVKKAAVRSGKAKKSKKKHQIPRGQLVKITEIDKKFKKAKLLYPYNGWCSLKGIGELSKSEIIEQENCKFYVKIYRVNKSKNIMFQCILMSMPENIKSIIIWFDISCIITNDDDKEKRIINYHGTTRLHFKSCDSEILIWPKTLMNTSMIDKSNNLEFECQITTLHIQYIENGKKKKILNNIDYISMIKICKQIHCKIKFDDIMMVQMLYAKKEIKYDKHIFLCRIGPYDMWYLIYYNKSLHLRLMFLPHGIHSIDIRYQIKAKKLTCNNVKGCHYDQDIFLCEFNPKYSKKNKRFIRNTVDISLKVLRGYSKYRNAVKAF